MEGWQGFPGQNNFLEFGKEPYFAGENGGIKGHVVYASTRPFDDPQLLVQTQWEPLVPHVTINLYQEGFAADGVTPTLTLVDHHPDQQLRRLRAGLPGRWRHAQHELPGPRREHRRQFRTCSSSRCITSRSTSTSTTRSTAGPRSTPLPNNSQFKCYDGMHNWNQLQPAPYDGMYKFPSVTAVDPRRKAERARIARFAPILILSRHWNRR